MITSTFSEHALRATPDYQVWLLGSWADRRARTGCYPQRWRHGLTAQMQWPQSLHWEASLGMTSSHSSHTLREDNVALVRLQSEDW